MDWEKEGEGRTKADPVAPTAITRDLGGISIWEDDRRSVEDVERDDEVDVGDVSGGGR